MSTRSYWVIGVMSGTSLDGLDIAFCEFWTAKSWQYRIHYAETISYTNEWKNKLSKAHLLNGYELTELHKDYGILMGEYIHAFIEKHRIKYIDLIASHGHTVFHQPDKQINLQIGNGAFISARTGISTVFDFRTLDIALGGQGAPLVPLGDELLFSEYTYCLNIGGISNISFKEYQKRVAFDVCPSNMVLNHLAQQKGLPYDKDGSLARRGKINQSLLLKLNQLSYYQKQYPKSLGREWVEREFLPLISAYPISIENKLATCTEHIAYQIGLCTQHTGNMLVTGGGAHNTFLVERIGKYSKTKIIVPNNHIVDFKEALIFAFLGLLRWKGKINILSSVTGAKSDSISGVCCKIEKDTKR